jgi:hypothetical protein
MSYLRRTVKFSSTAEVHHFLYFTKFLKHYAGKAESLMYRLQTRRYISIYTYAFILRHCTNSDIMYDQINVDVDGDEAVINNCSVIYVQEPGKNHTKPPSGQIPLCWESKRLSPECQPESLPLYYTSHAFLCKALVIRPVCSVLKYELHFS